MLLLYKFVKTQCNILRLSLNRRDTLLDLRTLVIYVLSLNLYAVTKQGPAVTVIPVLTPINPYLLKSLFVFYQNIYLFFLSVFVIENLYF